MAEINMSTLPLEVRAKLAELDLEISEGDITQKGYDKKRARLLEPYYASARKNAEEARSKPPISQPQQQQQQNPNSRDGGTPRSRAPASKKVIERRQRHSRRDDRYRSDIHTEAVQVALAKHRSKRVPVLPLPVKRRSLMFHGTANSSLGDSTDDEVTTDISTGDDDGSLRRGTVDSSSGQSVDSRSMVMPSPRAMRQVIIKSEHPTPSPRSSLHSSGDRRQSQDQPTPLAQKLADIMPQILPGSRPLSQNIPPDVANIPRPVTSASVASLPVVSSLQAGSKQFVKTSSSFSPELVQPKHGKNGKGPRRASSVGSADDNDENIAVTKVSAKIQQLLLTLKDGHSPEPVRVKNAVIDNNQQRPKKKPLAEYFQDDQVELMETNVVDEGAPKPVGAVTAPREGGNIPLQTNMPHSLEAAIHRFGTANPKSPCLTQVDMNGKIVYTLTYGKLLSRMKKVAYTLQHKKYGGLQSGQRAALVFPNSEPIAFITTFYGCMLAGVVPVVVEVPMSSDDPGSARLGFLLGNCGVGTALTSENCFKALPKNEKGEVTQLKGWPKLHWVLTSSRHLQKPSSGWEPSAPSSADQLAYIEYKTGKEGSVVGIAHTRTTVHRHCRALVSALSYNTADVVVNLLDFKKGFGLMHGIMVSIFNGMHVFNIPYALMKQNPSQWLNIVTKYQASIVLAKSRDLHWTLSMNRNSSMVDLKTVRMLLVSDGANPWSIGACDMFISEYEKRNLRREAVCPCAWSSEALTVAIRRSGSEAYRTALSLQDLSHSVIHEETPSSQNPSVVLQDCGNILPGTSVAVVRLDKDPNLCCSDEIGEILLCTKPVTRNRNSDVAVAAAPATPSDDVSTPVDDVITTAAAAGNGSYYYGLKGLSERMFAAHPIDEGNHSQRDMNPYIRTGLVGYVTPSGRLMVTGKKDGIIKISGRNHNADDLVATVLAIDSVRIMYKGRIAVFSVPVLRDERLVIIVEQKPETSEDQCFKWMSSVIQAMDTVHNVGVYCLSLVSPNGLPRTPLGGIHLSETRSRFLDGNLKPRNILMSPHQCVLNLPKPRQKHNDVGAASILQGQVVKGVRLAEAKGRPLNISADDDACGTGGVNKRKEYLAEILKWRSSNTPDHLLFNQIGGKGTVTNQLSCAQLHKKAEKIAQLLFSPSSNQVTYVASTGDHVALLFHPGIELIQAFYGCLYAGLVPVLVRPPNPRSLPTTYPTVKMILEVSKVSVILSSSNVIRLLRSKEAQAVVPLTNLPQIVDIDDAPKKKLPITYVPPTPEMLAYVDFSITTAGTLAGIKMSHCATIKLCRSIKLQCELYPSRSLALCLEPYNGLSLALWCLSSIYSGHQSMLLAPSELEAGAHVWLQMLSQHKIRDVFLSYGVVEQCTKDLAAQIPTLKSRGLTLNQLRTCVIVAEERPRVQITMNFTKLFRDLGLSPRAVSTAFGCRVNVAVCLQPDKLGILSEQIIADEPTMGSSCPDPTTVYVDMRALRNDRIALVEKGSPHSLCLMETGKILPGVKVVIADADTMGQCSDSRLGEIWVSSPHTAQGYSAVYGGDADVNYADHFQAKLRTGDTQTVYARTGFLGFLRRTELTSATGERHDALYIVGSLEDTLELRGMRYHPIDIENSVTRCSNKIAECAVFHSTNLLVVVVELDGAECHALDLVPLVTNVVLEEHYLIPGVVAVIDPGAIPVNSRGEKQRMHLKDAFLQDHLDPIYVAYNM